MEEGRESHRALSSMEHYAARDDRSERNREWETSSYLSSLVCFAVRETGNGRRARTFPPSSALPPPLATTIASTHQRRLLAEAF